MGPLEQSLVNALVNNGVRVKTINVRDEGLTNMDARAVLLINDVVKSLVISSLFPKTLNPLKTYQMALNRVTLYNELRHSGIPTPKYQVALEPNVVAKVIKEMYRAYLATPSMSLELDGIVTSWEGGKSIAEHRVYLGNPLVSINMVMPAPEKIQTHLVVGGECLDCGDNGELIKEVAKVTGCYYCRVSLGYYGGEPTVLGIDPRIELRQEHLDKFINTVMRWLNE